VTTATPADGRAKPPRALLSAVLAGMRPRQWPKNLLVLAAPAAAVKLGDPSELGAAALGVVAFTAASAGLYLVNDVIDREEDAHHPVKRRRPVAAGSLTATAALGCGTASMLCGLGLGLAVSVEFAAVVAGYLALMLAYAVWLRRAPVVEMAVVASGFIIRALGGAVAVDVPVSRWFVIVTSFGSLFVVAGKRLAELIASRGLGRRAVLDQYPEQFLRHVTTASLAVTIGAYCLWSFERAAGSGSPWFELSIAPFALFVLRYVLLVEQGHGEAPEELVLGDRGLLAIAAVWCALFAIAVYV
jgi:decaprenyl-phosphate phosphoribosyltransferase